MKVEPIRRSTAADQVLESLYEMITSGRFLPGGKLPSQDELAQQFGVSRNTLREAVHKLSAMGLLKARQGIGTTVEPVSPASYLSTLKGHLLLDSMSVREFIEARICIERTAVRLAVERAGAEDVRRLLANLEEQRKAVKKRDIAEFTRHDASFHLAVTQICGNRVLLKFLQTIQDMLHRFIGEVARLPGAIEDALRFHRQMTDAMVAKDRDLAEKVMVLHLFDVARRIEDNLNMDLMKESLCGYQLVRVDLRKSRSRRPRRS